jgi:hypothetical protein
MSKGRRPARKRALVDLLDHAIVRRDITIFNFKESLCEMQADDPNMVLVITVEDTNGPPCFLQ